MTYEKLLRRINNKIAWTQQRAKERLAALKQEKKDLQRLYSHSKPTRKG